MQNTINTPSEQKEVNFDTHQFVTFDGIDYNCAGCDCKPHNKAANLPCDARGSLD